VEKTLGPVVVEADARTEQEPGAGGPTSRVKQLLLVESRDLNPENEMKRIFGSRVIASDIRFVFIPPILLFYFFLSFIFNIFFTFLAVPSI
jgi:hypothetical protein